MCTGRCKSSFGEPEYELTSSDSQLSDFWLLVFLVPRCPMEPWLKLITDSQMHSLQSRSSLRHKRGKGPSFSWMLLIIFIPEPAFHPGCLWPSIWAMAELGFYLPPYTPCCFLGFRLCSRASNPYWAIWTLWCKLGAHRMELDHQPSENKSCSHEHAC